MSQEISTATLFKQLNDGVLERYGGLIRETSTSQPKFILVESPQATSLLQAIPNNSLVNTSSQTELIQSNLILATANIAIDKSKQYLQDHVDDTLKEAFKNTGEKAVSKIRESFKGQVKNIIENETSFSPLQSAKASSSSLIPIHSPSSLSIRTALGLSQITAAASVLNLGVSVAGFMYMNHKLNQLRASLQEFEQAMHNRFDIIDSKLDFISSHVSNLYLLAQINNEEIILTQRMIIDEKLALLSTLIQNRYLLTNKNEIRASINRCTEARIFLSAQADNLKPELNLKNMLVVDPCIRGWVISVAIEVQLLLDLGKHSKAFEIINGEIYKFQRFATNWADKLLEFKINSEKNISLSTAYRFMDEMFDPYISNERVTRIIRISSFDKNLDSDMIFQVKNKAEVELSLSQNTSIFDDNWIMEQIVIAEFLDSLSELLARLHTLLYFSKECETRLVSSFTELLPDETNSSGIFLLPTTT